MACKIINRKKLYGFNAGKEYKFILVKFNNTRALYKCKNLWYNISKDIERPGRNKYVLKEEGFKYGSTSTYLYEANIPTLLRLFHIQEFSPSGWVEAA